MINFETVYRDIYDIVQPLITPIPLIRNFQSDSKPAPKYCTYRITNIKPIGFEEIHSTATDGVYELWHTYSMRIQFIMIGAELATDAAALQIKTMRTSVIDAFAAAGLHFYDRTEVKDVPKLMATGYEDRSTFDLSFYLRIVDQDDTGWIEFVETTIEISDATGTVIVSETETIDLDP